MVNAKWTGKPPSTALLSAFLLLGVLSVSNSFQPSFIASNSPPRSCPPSAGAATPASPLRSTAALPDSGSDTARRDEDGSLGRRRPGSIEERRRTPLSMTINELSRRLGGRGRALAAWDCYRAGVDPLLYYDPSVPDADLDWSVSALTGNVLETTREEIQAHLPAKRRTEGLGRDALAKVAGLYGGDGAGIEGSVAALSKISVSSDGTTKILVRLVADGNEVETVIIPWEERGRSTLCVSSQVGCRQGCTFCATGRMGRIRSLTADEILAQAYHSRRVCRALKIHDVDNVVFMGMGEPADNADAVVRATEVLTDRQLFGMAQSRVTVSTVAPDPDAFGILAAAPAVLAWSVHAAGDELRRKLVPTTGYSMEELRRGFVSALLSRPRKLRTTMLEVALIEDVNDGPGEADDMADLALRIREDVPGAKVVVNLIPFNDIGHPTYRKPSNERVWAYQDRLKERDVMVYVRTTRGDDESAACGQLATKRKGGEM